MDKHGVTISTPLYLVLAQFSVEIGEKNTVDSNFEQGFLDFVEAIKLLGSEARSCPLGFDTFVSLVLVNSLRIESDPVDLRTVDELKEFINTRDFHGFHELTLAFARNSVYQFQSAVNALFPVYKREFFVRLVREMFARLRFRTLILLTIDRCLMRMDLVASVLLMKEKIIEELVTDLSADGVIDARMDRLNDRVYMTGLSPEYSQERWLSVVQLMHTLIWKGI